MTIYRLLSCIPAAFALLGAEAAQIAASGADTTTTRDAWRTASVAKPLDVDGDNVYGTDGYLMFQTGYSGDKHVVKPNVFADASDALPRYVTVLPAGATASLGSAKFAMIDDPTEPGSDLLSGVALVSGVAPGAEVSIFKLVLKNQPAQGVRVGVMVNNAVDRNPGAVRLALDGDATVTATHHTAQSARNQACYFFFDVTGLSGTSTLTLYVTEDTTDNNKSGEVRIGGLTFDTLR
ncbi:MAG: hypothetical protein MUE42_07390 [Opitutaceae bacterium]|jgi:hypothetical protein|nr:hypothetical protein [Opitutaceae bacterium]